MRDDKPYSPLDREHLGESVADALLEQPPIPLADLQRFVGAGIYSLYYSGEFAAYQPIRFDPDGESLGIPIYVGRALPTGTRKGSTRPTQGRALWGRFSIHKRTIEAAENLELSDFNCRYLLVEDIWIPLGESLLIDRFSPLWNVCLDGFGNNKPGRRRATQKRSMWDTLHPGREWAAEQLPNDKTAEEISQLVIEFLRQVENPIV